MAVCKELSVSYKKVYTLDLLGSLELNDEQNKKFFSPTEKRIQRLELGFVQFKMHRRSSYARLTPGT